jgi:RimJ/RimL family protein N-acetyltransferase
MATRQTDVSARSAIETPRLRLERWDDSHFEDFARFMRDPAVTQYIRARPLDHAQAVEQHEHSLRDWDLLGLGKRAIVETSTDEWLGFVELSPVGPGKGTRDEDIEIGFFVEPHRWGEGIATEAALATRDEAFDRRLTELIGRCRVENLASAAVLAKVGFRRLRLFELDDGVVIVIHRLERGDWTGPVQRRPPIIAPRDHKTGSEYRETG